MKIHFGRKYLLLLISLLSANPRASADTLEFANGQSMQTEQINPQETANNFQYGIVKVNYTSTAVTNLKLGEKEEYKILSDSIFVTEAHAATTPVDQNIFTAGQRAHDALRSAIRFKDVEPFISKDAYQALLTQKRNSNGKELMILQLLKNSIPSSVEIIQTQVKGDLAWAVARGKMNGQSFWGILALSNEEGNWKLIEETWYGNQTKPVSIKTSRTADEFLKEVNNQPGGDFIRWVDKAGQPKSSLPLEYGTISTPKRSFCFFFFLDPDKSKKKTADENGRMVEVEPSPDVHVVWPTGFRHDPKVYEGNNSEGFDVSVAADKDGYYPNKMNLRMPKGKPREIYVGFLMNF